MYVIPRRYVTRLPIDFTKIWDKNAIFFDVAIEENDENKLQSWGSLCYTYSRQNQEGGNVEDRWAQCIDELFAIPKKFSRT